ncbi:ABC transporter permease [Alkaliphilus serpentinus]|uniref:ABC transporter permease n=1 Tax=Alkaliphilus serpentinus TaxID=1482731 RepID=A0A833HMX2_9FIRM|nr:ABC transporter permease [Alkaliphilus serpentinus]KAB3528837.1 ABC transporter permease [Alkaliphilus serpentinus]
MNILNKLTLKNLQLNRRRTIVTIIGIILSGAMICGVAALATSFQDLLVQGAKKTDGNYHAIFYNVKYENSKYITSHAYTKTSMLTKDIGYGVLETPRQEEKPYLFIKAYDAVALESLPLTLLEGRLPNKEGEMLVSIELKTAEAKDYLIGDTITIDIGSRMEEGNYLGQDIALKPQEKLVTYNTKTYTITGYIQRPRNEYPASPGHTAIAFLDEGNLLPQDEVNVSILGVKPKKIFEKVPQIAETAGVTRMSYNNELLKWMGISQNEALNNMFGSLALIIISLVVVGSVSVIYNAFAISVSERKKQFGMLASVGATAYQIRRMVFYEGLIIGLIGIPIGILSGFLGIGITLKVVNHLMVDSIFGSGIALRLIINPTIVITTILFVGLTIFLSAYFPARRASKISPIDAIRLTTDIKLKAKKLRTSKLTRILFGMEGELALKNLKRNRKRYRATVFSLFISIVLFVSFSAFMTYGFASSELYYGDIPFDVGVISNEAPTDKALELFEEISEFDHIERVSIHRTLRITGEIPDISLFGQYLREQIQEHNMLEENSKGNYEININVVSLTPEEHQIYLESLDAKPASTKNLGAILVNKNIVGGRIEYEPLNLEVGDKLDIQSNNSSLQLEVTELADSIPFGGRYNSMATITMIVEEDVFEEIYQAQSKDIQKNNLVAHIAIKSSNSAKLMEDIKSLIKTDGNKAFNVVDITTMKQEMERMRIVIAIFLYGFVSLITLIGVTNIFNTISTNVALRRREFAMLKSVGLTPEGFNKMINFESIFYGLKALLYGLPVSGFLSLLMHNSFGNLFEFEFVLPWKEIFICIAGVFIVVFVTMMYSSAKLKRENIIDALKEENL